MCVLILVLVEPTHKDLQDVNLERANLVLILVLEEPTHKDKKTFRES